MTKINIPGQRRDYRQLDAELVDAWLNTVEAKQQIEAVDEELKSRNKD